MAFKMAGPRDGQLRGARRRKNTWYPGKYLIQGVKKIFGGKKAKINIRKEPKINLIKWFLAHGSQSPPAAEYNSVIPIAKIKHNKINIK